MDEVDTIFDTTFRSDFFSMLRAGITLVRFSLSGGSLTWRW